MRLALLRQQLVDRTRMIGITVPRSWATAVAMEATAATSSGM